MQSITVSLTSNAKERYNRLNTMLYHKRYYQFIQAKCCIFRPFLGRIRLNVRGN